MLESLLYFIQQLINGLTLGSAYALIAIGYTMVYGIIGMINFAHGEIYMIGTYVAFLAITAMGMLGIEYLPVVFLFALLSSILVSSAFG
jgi:branched-chain amino acid transport system permease protein